MRKILSIIASVLVAYPAFTQSIFDEAPIKQDIVLTNDTIKVIDLPDSLVNLPDSLVEWPDSLPKPWDNVCDSLLYVYQPEDTVISMTPLPRVFFTPTVFRGYQMPDTTSVFTPELSGNPALRWIEDANAQAARVQTLQQNMFIAYPGATRYNLEMLPEAIKQYTVVVDPQSHSIDIKETTQLKVDAPTIAKPEIERRHWIHTFNTSLQFSQAFVSPNWYQGGKNNLNMLANAYYNIKLNTQFHPNLLFETTVQYKLGLNNAPDDTYHPYNISDDIFQVNTTFGLKAAKRWYYSFTGQFKTQLFNSYKSNSDVLRAALLSPAELTAGLGMTYNYATPQKAFTLDVSVAPISMNMKICTDSRMTAAVGLNPGETVKTTFGSSAELKWSWKIAYNISWRSRLFGFTDFERAYTDWENTVVFEINRFFTTQLFFNMRYDTHTPPIADEPSWKKLQLKEIISIGFAYKFSSI